MSHAEDYKKWVANNRDKRRAIDNRYYQKHKAEIREKQMRIKFSITKAQYDEMFLAQGCVCAICKRREPGGRWNSFHVDHCHATMTFRGILCDKCNKGIGHFNDKPDLLVEAASYLRKARGERW